MQTTKKNVLAPFDASQWRLGIVVARFNRDITDELLKSALARAGSYKIPPSKLTTVEVAGCVEIPLVLQTMAKTGRYQALLALGCVIKGETPHFDYVCQFVTDGILRIQLEHETPIGFGILTCNNIEQAKERANLGGDFLDAALQQAKVLSQINSQTK